MDRWESFTDAELEKLSEVASEQMRQQINEVLEARTALDMALGRFNAFRTKELVALKSALGNSSFDVSFTLLDEVKSELNRRQQRTIREQNTSIAFPHDEAVAIYRSLICQPELDAAYKSELTRIRRRFKAFFKIHETVVED